MATKALSVNQDGGVKGPVPKSESSILPGPAAVVEGRGKYRLGKVLGAGSAGTVYLSDVIEQPQDGGHLPDQVAVKILNKLEERPLQGHRIEISVMREVHHPNVVRIHDWGLDGSHHFAVLDYHSSGSLLKEILTTGSLSPGIAHRLLRDMLFALVETHRLGILHLDIKPGNVLIGDDGRFLLTDFGIAQALFQRDNDRIIGTPAFMSPEQARGENDRLDGRSDLFSLGAMLWYVITGDFSQKRRSQKETLAERGRNTLPELAFRVASEIRPLAQVVDRLLAFDLRRRPGSAAEVLMLLDEIEPESSSGNQAKSQVVHGGAKLTKQWRVKLRETIADPVSLDLLKRWGTFYRLRLYGHGEVICEEEEQSFDVHILLHGEVEVHRRGVLLAVESREGTIMGEVAALIGNPRTAMLRARGDTVLASLNGAELEQAARMMPGLALRMMKGLAKRLAERDMKGT